MSRKSAVPLLARRFLVSKHSDGFLSLIAWVSVLGVALGVLALTVVTSVINGFQGELTHVITGMNGDVILYAREPITNPDKIEEKIRSAIPETRGVTRAFVTELMAAGPTGVAGAVLEGIDGATVGEVTALPKRVVSGRLPMIQGEYALGSALAERIGATEGTEVRMILPFVGGGDSEAPGANRDPIGAPKIVTGTVTGIVTMGLNDYDSQFVFAPIEAVQAMLNQPKSVTSFKIKLAPRVSARAVSDRLTEIFGYPFRAKDWSQLNRNLFYAIELEKVVISIILTVIVIVAAFNVISTLMMMIHDKTKEIAILKAMGFRAAQSFRLFCLIGMGIGSVGIAAGIGLGLGVNLILERTRFVKIPADIYRIGFLPVVVNWAEVITIGIVALLITFVATFFPAWKVSTRPPLDGIRFE